MREYQPNNDKVLRRQALAKKLKKKQEQFQDDSMPQKKRHPWRVMPACSTNKKHKI